MAVDALVSRYVEVYSAYTTQFTPADLEDLDRLYNKGDLGELRMVMAPGVTEAETKSAMAEAEDELRQEGVKPWPGNSRIMYLDWRKRTVYWRWQQGMPLLLVVAGRVVVYIARLWWLAALVGATVAGLALLWTLTDPSKMVSFLKWLAGRFFPPLGPLEVPWGAVALVGGGSLLLLLAVRSKKET